MLWADKTSLTRSSVSPHTSIHYSADSNKLSIRSKIWDVYYSRRIKVNKSLFRRRNDVTFRLDLGETRLTSPALDGIYLLNMASISLGVQFRANVIPLVHFIGFLTVQKETNQITGQKSRHIWIYMCLRLCLFPLQRFISHKHNQTIWHAVKSKTPFLAVWVIKIKSK